MKASESTELAERYGKKRPPGNVISNNELLYDNEKQDV